ELGNISFLDSNNPDNSFGFNKKFSDETAKKIDEAVRNIIDAAYVRTKDLLIKHKDQLEEMAQALLKKEILSGDDLLRMLGDRPFGNYPTKHADLKPLEKHPIVNGSATTEVADAAEEVKPEPETPDESSKVEESNSAT